MIYKHFIVLTFRGQCSLLIKESGYQFIKYRGLIKKILRDCYIAIRKNYLTYSFILII